ncbi:MAG: type II toxin-antitoxin system Phd/YefM family antitoxin [Okeania sp. SIO3I5]|uniref:type II toxin-antitoxin system Phd/YefM family antitoxin n=1 Tax=Okeania sp. SIO3I5 TaxID=2607805 RepID=UPI0013BB7772|nr:type II toxin-antitoxin system Phd/YefM family antitoxin [Okeania sp. SIO3I5]NEQ38115.1 type II toxin-antitoxin system Phd/YefM family antitoxin [Okeania sp. SIO3I5]
MLDITKDIDSLTNFKRNTAAYLERIKESGHPLVLTVNGKAEVVVQDAESYQKLLELVDRIQAIEGIQAGLKSVREGRTFPAKEALTKLKQKHEISS